MAALGEEALQAQRRHERTGRPLGSTALSMAEQKGTTSAV